jgi:hypothetical protein
MGKFPNVRKPEVKSIRLIKVRNENDEIVKSLNQLNMGKFFEVSEVVFECPLIDEIDNLFFDLSGTDGFIKSIDLTKMYSILVELLLITPVKPHDPLYLKLYENLYNDSVLTVVKDLKMCLQKLLIENDKSGLYYH